MIFRSVVSAMVVVTIASAAVIPMPNNTTTPAPNEFLTTTMIPADTVTTMKPADTITTVKPADTITTVKPEAKITTVKPAAPETTQAPMISCYCNLPECSVAAGGDGTCSTRLGCYSEVQPIIPGIEEEIVTPNVTESTKPANGSATSPIVSELVEFVNAPVVATTEHAAAIRGSFGCLDQLNFAKQSCDEILKSMEAEASEFPVIQVPTNGALPSATNAGIHAFHCCQTERCNGNQSGPAEGSVKSAQAVLVAELKNTFAPQVIHIGMQNSTVGVPWTPTVFKSSVSDVETSNTESSVNNVESSIVKKLNTVPSSLWNEHFPMSEPKPPSVLQTDTSSEDATKIDATTPAIPIAMPPTLPVAVPANQEITHDETMENVKHIVTKRHDGPKGM